MRYDDARLSRETESVWLKLRLLWTRTVPKLRAFPYADLSALSDHELEDIGITRREARMGRRGPPLL